MGKLKKYKALVEFNIGSDNKYVYRGRKHEFSNDPSISGLRNALELSFNSNKKYKSHKWWNEASDKVIDSMKGTDFKNVKGAKWFTEEEYYE